MTHKTKECLSRPRVKGAKWTGTDIQADEVVQDIQLGWDAKRDRWNGYDATEYRTVIEEYEELESLKKKAKVSGESSEQKLMEENEEEAQAREEEEAKYAEESDMGRQQSTATRNLRIREDTAKYLLNLDLDSARYDPKTRSMVDMGAQADQAAALVAEDNFMRASGDAAEFERAQKYAWESQERGDKNKTHLQANPTSGEYHRRQEKEGREAKRETQRKLLLEKYGGEHYLKPPLFRDAVVTENEKYIEYDDSGAVKGASKAEFKSKYGEDVLINNHKSVWGSWWKNFKWGYACCHSSVKNSYCTGEEGKTAFEQANKVRTGTQLENSLSAEAIGRKTEFVNSATNTDVTSDLGSKLDPDGVVVVGTKKRTMNVMKGDVSEEELEAYKRSRLTVDDPMAKFLGKNELVH